MLGGPGLEAISDREFHIFESTGPAWRHLAGGFRLLSILALSVGILQSLQFGFESRRVWPGLLQVAPTLLALIAGLAALPSWWAAATTAQTIGDERKVGDEARALALSYIRLSALQKLLFATLLMGLVGRIGGVLVDALAFG